MTSISKHFNMSSKDLTDFYINEETELGEFKCNPEVIINKNFIKYIRGVCPVDERYTPPLSLDWYPRCNSYYPYTEDVDAINRVDHLLAAKAFLESFTTIKKDQINNFDAYHELESELRYLQSKPATFLILGKPGIGELQLGKLLSEYWKCIYIDPETLVEEEIRSGSRAGQCIEFNLRCGRAISIDVILRLMEKRVKSKSAQHRGFVICGFPLIRNDMYQEDPVSSESAIFTVQDIFEEILEPIGKSSHAIRNVSKTSRFSSEYGESEAYEELEEPEEMMPDEEEFSESQTTESPEEKPLPFIIDIGSAGDIFKSTDLGTNYTAQLNFLFSLCHDPLVIIYIMCQNYDVVTKHEHCRYNLKTNEVVNLMKDQSESVIYTIYTKKPGFDTEELPDDLIDVSGYSSGLSSSDLMYLTYLPCNFSGNVQHQLEQYRFDALPTIEKHVLLHDPQYFIKVDGRLSPSKMFNIIKFKLKILPLPMVYIPEKLIEPIIPTGGEAEALEVFDYEDKTPEECFDVLKTKKIVNRMFKLRWSRWGSACPVAMKEGTYASGKSNLAVKFLNHIYFLSDQLALTKFLRNPRSYLLPPYPRPTCKVLIIGPSASGKSAVAKCLGLLLNGKVLEAISLQQDYMKQMGKERLDKIRTDAINEAIQMLTERNKKEYEAAERERTENKQQWISKSKTTIAEWLLLDRTIIGVQGTDISSFPQRRSITHSWVDPDILAKFMNDITRVKQQFEELGLSFYDDIEECTRLNADPSGLDDYVPIYLKNPITPPEAVSIFDEFVTKYADEKVQTSNSTVYKMSLSDTGDMYVNSVRAVENQNIEAGEYHGGWILVGVQPNPETVELILEKCKPDNILVFRDPECSFLLERYKIFGQNEFSDYQTFFESIDKSSIAKICPITLSTHSYKTRLVRGLLDEVLDGGNLEYLENDSENHPEDEPNTHEESEVREVGFVDEDYFASRATRLELKHYENDLQTFDADCERLLEYFDDLGLQYTEIIVTDKSLEDLMKEVVTYVDSKYRYHAHQFTSEERVEEVEDFGEPELEGEGLDEEGEEKLPEGGGSFMQNRRLGDTNVYCPINFRKNWILWKGKEEYGAVYNGKLYFMATEEALDTFITSPREYILKEPIDTLPPPRICVVGVPGSGKTTLARALCISLGLYYVSYEDYLKRTLHAEHIEANLETLLNHSDNPEVEAITAYLDTDEPLTEELLSKINLREIWYDEPKRSVGFVLDGFPRRPSDVRHVEQLSLIPDVVIELAAEDMEVNERYIRTLLKEWQQFVEKEQEEQDIVNRQFLAEWEVTRNNRIEELMEERRQARYQAKMQERRESKETSGARHEEDQGVSDVSLISYDSVVEEADLEEVTTIVQQEFPEPVFEDNWETLEEATERIVNQTHSNYTADVSYLSLLKESFENRLIEWVSIDASLSISKVLEQAMIIVDNYKFRNRSFFERCYDVSLEIAEKLLSDGYHFLSRFGKACPVQTCERSNSVLMYYPLEQKMELFPVIHRNYIYFLAGKKNKDKFVNDPLFYIMQSDVSFPLIPFRIAIIGPPKSGKTALVERFKHELGLKCVSIGQAARYVLRFLPFSKLAKEMEFVLRNGWELTSEMSMRCVEAMAFDGRAITQGLVFDGFPNTRYDVDHLAEIGLIPHLVIHLDADMDEIYAFLNAGKGKKGLPVFSEKFIDHRCEEWFKLVSSICNWLDTEYQVWTKLKVRPCKWGVWTMANELALATMFEIKYYFKNCNRDMALHLANMQVTSAEFTKRQSCYKHYCPSCLFYNNTLVSGGEPPDRTGLMQFKNKFYWLCSRHIDEFANDPDSYLPPYNDKVLPGDLPLCVILEDKPNNCYEDGVCVVCYWDSQYEKVLKQGLLEHACSYKDKIYLFDTKECRSKFLNRPHRYFSKTAHFKDNRPYASLKMEHLPVLGMLEQYVVRSVIKAITNTCATRPVIAGLDIQQSAAINIALHLKIHNPNTPKEFLPLYERAHKVFNERRLEFINALARMKRTMNPYLHYEEPLEKFVLPQSDAPSSEKEVCSGEESLIGEITEEGSELGVGYSSSMEFSLFQRVLDYLEPE